MTDEVWILGATGRTGSGVAVDLAVRGVRVVLVGRDAARLDAVAAPLGARAVVAASMAETRALLRREAPAVVVNTVGPFTATAAPVLEVLPTGAHYVDIANDMAAVPAVLARHGEAVTRGSTWVTGAGFGVTATESAVLKLCEDRGPADAVRIDMVPSLAQQAGALGEALARTILEGLPGVPGGGRYQGRRYRTGRLEAARIAGSPMHLVTPDGDRVTTALLPLGELIAAQRASGAPAVDGASSEAPSGSIARTLVPLALPLLGVPGIRRLAAGRLAAVQLTDRPAPRRRSWGHARARWSDGSMAEAWLGLPDAQAFTIAVAAEVAFRLLGGGAPAGAYTPGALFGSGLAESLGGEYVLDGSTVR